jgi:hypothetical protein
MAAGLVALISTFGLCYVVLNVATSRDQADRSTLANDFPARVSG